MTSENESHGRSANCPIQVPVYIRKEPTDEDSGRTAAEVRDVDAIMGQEEPTDE